MSFSAPKTCDDVEGCLFHGTLPPQVNQACLAPRPGCLLYWILELPKWSSVGRDKQAAARIANSTSQPRLVRVARDHQTEIYAPEESDNAPHDHTPINRNKSEIQQGYHWPELQAGSYEWPETLRAVISRQVGLGSCATNPLTITYNGLSVFALECTHNRNEEQRVHCRCQCLVQGELLCCVRLVQLLLSIDIRCISRKSFFEILLPEEVRRATEDCS